MGVDSGGCKGAVAKDMLDGFEIHAIFKPVCGNGVADGVRCDGECKTACFEILRKEPVD